MAEQPFAEISAKEPYAVAQANPAPESKWLNEITSGSQVMLEADRVLFRDPETDRSWNLSSLTVPLGIVLGRGAIQKTLFAGVGLLAGHAVDRIAPPPVQNKSALSTFTTLDAVPLGIAFAIPAKSPAVRAGLVGIAWAMGNTAETVAGGFKNWNSNGSRSMKLTYLTQ